MRYVSESMGDLYEAFSIQSAVPSVDLRILLPYIRYRKRVLAQRASEIACTRREEFPYVLQYLIEHAEGSDAEPISLAAMVLSLSLASNHTTTMALTEAPYGLCAYPEYQAELRAEVRAALDEDGGWVKTTLLKMCKLDSFMKESQRMHPPSLIARWRAFEFAIVPFQHDNTSDPVVFDGLRYYRMRETPSEAHRHQFATTSESVLHFGHGQNSCPGRFMASNVMKMVLGTLLTEYEVKLDQEGRPEGIHACEYNFSGPTARLLLRKRRQKEIA